MDKDQARQYINNIWDDEIVPELYEYIKIPNKSPVFDKNWQENGHMERAVDLMVAWAEKKASGYSRC